MHRPTAATKVSRYILLNSSLSVFHPAKTFAYAFTQWAKNELGIQDAKLYGQAMKVISLLKMGW